MTKKKKGVKIHNRVRKIRKDTLEKLNNTIPYLCQSCCNDCKGTIQDDTCDCINYSMTIDINDIIEELKVCNVDLDRFCSDYNLKKEFLIEMLKGKTFLKYKYYMCLLHRLRFLDEYEKYKERFLINEKEDEYYGIENNASDCEVLNK